MIEIIEFEMQVTHVILMDMPITASILVPSNISQVIEMNE